MIRRNFLFGGLAAAFGVPLFSRANEREIPANCYTAACGPYPHHRVWWNGRRMNEADFRRLGATQPIRLMTGNDGWFECYKRRRDGAIAVTDDRRGLVRVVFTGRVEFRIS